MSDFISDDLRTDFTVVTFVIPFRMDSADRRRNLHIVVSHLLRHFNTEVIVAEHDQSTKKHLFWRNEWPTSVRHVFIQAKSWFFHRSRCINMGAFAADTPFLILQDADAFVPADQYRAAADLMRGGRYSLAFPYENRVMWVPDNLVHAVTEPDGFRRLQEQEIPVSDDSHTIVSLAVLVDRAAFLEAGMMNEHCKSWGYEDVEFYERVLKLGCRFANVPGLVYHLDHERDENWGMNPFFEHNRQEYEKVCGMGAKELRSYIRTWPWLDAQNEMLSQVASEPH